MKPLRLTMMAAGRSRTKWKLTLKEIGMQVEADVQHGISFLNDQVVPELRRDGSRALRFAADELLRLARQFERRGNKSGTSSDSSW